MIKNAKKKRLIIEILIEILLFFLMYQILGIEKVMSISFGRYLFIFITIFILIRDKHNNNLVWQDARNLIVFYLVLFSISLVISPMKELTAEKVLLNLNYMFCSFVLVLLMKIVIRNKFFNVLCDNVLIVGTGNNAKILEKVCKSNKYSLMNIKGFLSFEDSNITIKHENEIDNIAITYDDIDSFISENSINTVLIAMPKITKQELLLVYDTLKDKVDEIKYMPQINGMYSYDTRVEDYDGLMLISNHLVKDTLYTVVIKRILDIIIGILGCVLLIPLTIVLKVIYIKNGDKDPIFFKQERIGKKGKKIIIYKYRSMVPNAEAVLEELMRKDENIRIEYLSNKKLENDPRITKVGKFIRKTSIDEFPQFINVLKGDMSFVGPRPYLFREIDDMGTFYDSIILAKPGITGMWQVSGRSDISFFRRCKMDEYYVNNQDFWLDFTIVIKTIKSVVSSKGAM